MMPQPAQSRLVADQLLYGVQALLYQCRINKGLPDPLGQEPGAERGHGFIKNPAERKRMFRLRGDGNKLKIFQRGFIQDHIVSGIKRERLFQVRERFMQVILKIIEKRPGRSNSGRHLRNAQAAERCDMKLLKDAIAGLLSIKDPVIVFIYYPGIFLFKSEAA